MAGLLGAVLFAKFTCHGVGLGVLHISFQWLAGVPEEIVYALMFTKVEGKLVSGSPLHVSITSLPTVPGTIDAPAMP
jgi:hypothetical protein